MKYLPIAAALIVSLSVVLSCRQQQQQTPSPVSDETSAAQTNKPRPDRVRIYEYDYEWDLQDLSENHFIVLEFYADSTAGRYYGTSDDFDDFREGYFPGFFVASMDSLAIRDGQIRFSLRVIREILFSKPIDLRLTTAVQARAAGWPVWLESFPEYELSRTRRTYTGLFRDDRIEIRLPDETRLFAEKQQLAQQTP